MNSLINLTLRVLRWAAVSVLVVFASIFAMAFTFDCSMEKLLNRVSVTFSQSVRSDIPIQELRVYKVVGLSIADFDNAIATGDIYNYDVQEDAYIVYQEPDSMMTFHIDMPGVYIVSTSGPQGENEPFVFLFDEDWVQQCIENDHATMNDFGGYQTDPDYALDASGDQPIYRCSDIW